MEKLMKNIFMRFGWSYLGCPVIGFVAFGSYSMYQQSLMLDYGLFLIVSALVVSILLGLLSFRRKKCAVVNEEPRLPDLEPGMGWGAKEIKAWDEINGKLDDFIKQDVSIGGLKDNALVIAGIAANHCSTSRFNGELGFTLPEFLLMTEEVSRRYREYLMENVPFIDKAKISTVKACYEHRDKANMAWNAYRAIRLSSPLGWMTELRSMIASEIMDGFTDDFMDKLLKVYYQEIAVVSINLYSRQYDGKLLKTPTASHQRDLESIEDNKLEPIRVGLIGEISAGKSTIVNTVFGKVMAEVSALPTTEGAMSYHLCNDDLDVMLVDTEGYGANPSAMKNSVKTAIKSDFVVVAVKANKPSKSTDLTALSEIKNALDKDRGRKKPYILVCLTHTDMINDDVRNVIDYNKSVFDHLGIVDNYCISNKDEDGAINIREQFIAGHDIALTSQFNRRRFDKTLSASVTQQLSRASSLSKEALRIMMA